MERSSFVRDELRYAGAAVTTMNEVVWAESMMAGIWAQNVELIALTNALELGQGK